MIGVHTSPLLRPVIEEFFELFKTPWEYYRTGRHYEVILCNEVEPDSYDTELLLVYSQGGCPDPDESSGPTPNYLSFEKYRIPIYKSVGSFQDSIKLRVNGREVGVPTTIHMGYNLFREIEFLLTSGQPAENAAIPALDLHISLLRTLVVRHTGLLIEVPCSPAGYSMIACLTHDVDHPFITKQPWWPTVFGFLYRATLGSVLQFARGRKRLAQVVRNWRAAFSLPLIYAGLAKDIWDCFEGYTEIEKQRPSTYFLIPIKGYAGRDKDDAELRKRAAGYAAPELASSISFLKRKGREIGVHGLDAWRCVEKGIQERYVISQLTGEKKLGVRMHWLYWNHKSPSHLEAAEYDYDSTVGYNETVGYRAGTTQIFKSPQLSRMLEVPLHMMDTALFYPDYLDLTSDQAIGIAARMISQCQQTGGILTVNWHDRSLAPERLWGEVYQDIVRQLTEAGAWFATCGDAVAWFRQRRGIHFENVNLEADRVLNVSIRSDQWRNDIPAMRLRVYTRPKSGSHEEESASFVDFDLNEASHHFAINSAN